MAYYAFKKAFAPEIAAASSPPDDLKHQQVIDALEKHPCGSSKPSARCGSLRPVFPRWPQGRHPHLACERRRAA